jgi:hypothetical protein
VKGCSRFVRAHQRTINTSQPCHPRLLSMVPSSRCQERLTVCERSATQKCINLPNSFFRSPRVRRRKQDRRGSNHPRRQKFSHPRSSTRSPLPMLTFWGSMSHIMWHFFILFQMIPTQADHGHGTSERQGGNGSSATYVRTASSRSSARILNLDLYQ